jgi:hypothetical protein
MCSANRLELARLQRIRLPRIRILGQLAVVVQVDRNRDGRPGHEHTQQKGETGAHDDDPAQHFSTSRGVQSMGHELTQ